MAIKADINGSAEWIERRTNDLFILSEDNPEVKGKLMEIKDGTYGELLSIDIGENTIVDVPVSTTMLNKVSKEDIGADLWIKFMGEKKSNSGRVFKDIKVLVKR
jgi:hypothetical protein